MRKTTAEIRQNFLDFFQKRAHHVEPSSSLVPHNDRTLLFTNAGMNQFKNFFLGIERPTYHRVTTAQRCLRAGGKHNDLEQVGYTTRHHTFFEMLGNFSFGDYFKKEAITAAWELLTSPTWFALPKERLWITVYESDDESYAIWENLVGIPPARIIRIGDNQGARYASDNFWQMGDSGPCGPCSEIFYDHGDTIAGGLPGSATAEGDRYVEIWNLVFIQFNRQTDGTLHSLPTPCVDTGMGLERIAAVLQGVHSNYQTDVFRALIGKAAEITHTTDLSNPSLCIIADHIRASAFLIADGVIPSNEGRGYVLRRIIRRAVRHGQKLGIKAPFFYQLIAPLIAIMSDVTHEVKRQQTMIEHRLKSEEQLFIDNLQRSVVLLTEQLAIRKENKLSGVTAFKLYDTYGLPLDLTIDICREHNVKVDTDEFDRAMECQRQRAQKASHFMDDHNQLLPFDHTTLFCGYEQTHCFSEVVDLRYAGEQGKKEIAMISEGEEAIVFLNQTPFYGAAGGQVGDKGFLTTESALFTVHDTRRCGQALAHIGRLTRGVLSIGDRVSAQVDDIVRQAICLNHSATHLLHAALRQILGEHVLQKGSSVSASSLRFDFSHFAPLTLAQRYEVEQLVNTHIRLNDQIKTEILDLATAKAKGAMALFDEQYGERVRVLTIGKFSIELCGGTHATRTGDIGLFHILSESGIATGVRRIEAVTGAVALQRLQHQQQCFLQAASLVKDNNGQQLVEKVHALLESKQYLEKQVQRLQKKLAIQESNKLMDNIITIKDVRLIVTVIQNIEASSLINIVDNLKHRVGSVVILLATHCKDRVHLIAGVSKDLVRRITATELINRVARQVGGKGGGRSELAQATGNNVNAVSAALTSAIDWITTKL